MLFTHVYLKHLLCERIKGLQKSLKTTESAFSDAQLMSRGKTALCATTTHTHTHTHTHTTCGCMSLSVCLSLYASLTSESSNQPYLFDCRLFLGYFQFFGGQSKTKPREAQFFCVDRIKKPREARFFCSGQRHGQYSSAHRI